MTQSPIRLLLCDIDGTLVRHDKSLPERNIAAIKDLTARGLPVSLISARPEAGILPIAAQLGLPGPFGAFNGGTVFGANGHHYAAHRLPADLAEALLALYAQAKVTRWLFSGDQWLTTDLADPHTPREIISAGLQPHLVQDFTPWLAQADKIVAVCDDPAAMAELRERARDLAAERADVVLSQDYYLDATATLANKGDGAAQLAALYGVPLSQVAVIGDQANDIAMFRRAGLAIAMGQAKPAVQAEAQFIAASCEDAGVADAIERFILPRL